MQKYVKATIMKQLLLRTKKKSATFKLNKIKKKAILEINNGEKYECIFKKENGRINIYHKIKGMGDAKATQIKALFEFIKRNNLAKKVNFRCERQKMFLNMHRRDCQAMIKNIL